MADPDPDLADQVRAARHRMHQRFEAGERMQHALALGQLDRARQEAELVNSLEEPDAVPEWRSYIDNVRAAAREVAAAKTTITAARSTALLGRRCARCHEASNTRIAFAKLPVDAPDARLRTQMASHSWAAARMWEGLIGPDDTRWLLGARKLAAAKVAITAENGSLGIADDAARMRLLGERAIKTTNRDDRTTLYGDLLAICAHCHAVIRD